VEELKMLQFEFNEIKNRFQSFINEFLSGEENVQRVELPLNVWMVSVPAKNFKVMITCRSHRSPYGFEEWCAVVEEPNGERSNYLLFEEEIEDWLSEQRKLRGIGISKS
jgi:hypothetical protein